jgi:hypothetical protein
MARMVQDIQESKQQLQTAMEQQAKQLEDCKQQLKDQQARSVIKRHQQCWLCLLNSNNHDTG